MENSSRAKLAALKQELRPLKYPWNSIEENQILGGDCRGFFPIFRALIHAYWPSVGSRFVDTYEEQDILGLAGEVQASDPRTSIALVLGDLERTDVIVHKIYKFAREVLRMDIRLKESQFVSQGFQRNKIDFMVQLVRSIKKFHQVESKQTKRGHRISALHRAGNAPEQQMPSPERTSNIYSEPKDTNEEAHPRPIPPYVQARCLQNFSCAEIHEAEAAGDSEEFPPTWFPSAVPFEGQEEHALASRNREISEDFSYLHDMYGNLETNWLGAMPLTLDDSDTTWLTNPDESMDISGMRCAEKRDYGLPLVNPLYSDASQERRQYNSDSFDPRKITCQRDQDLNSLLESLEIHMDQASNILLN